MGVKRAQSIVCAETGLLQKEQGKGNCPLPLQLHPQNQTKICQLCPRSNLSTLCPAGHAEMDLAAEGRKKLLFGVTSLLGIV